ncbi:MAG: hypothetical protein NTU88_13285 [Armatimonadetes bacterium]|nr:hypothetical protein [Armatimonadota bacterium]
MKPTAGRIASALAILLVLASCSTMQRISDEKGAAWVAQQLNESNAAELAAISSSPFLLDGETIALHEDTAAFWNGLVKAGMKLDPGLSRALQVGADTWREFGSTRDVQIFFGKYVAEGARLFELPTANGRRVLVLYRSSWGSRKLYGFKGPY